jgi:hypothetical protein
VEHVLEGQEVPPGGHYVEVGVPLAAAVADLA